MDSFSNSVFYAYNIQSHFNVVWCNGSTKDFGSFSIGSNPVTTTNKYDVPQVEVINAFACGILY